MKTSRQRLLDFIQAHSVVSAAEIGQALRMSEANARHHLSILKNQGLVEVSGQRPAQGKGRPTLLYSLSQQTLGDNLPLLAGALLDELRASLSPEAYISWMRRISQRLLEQHSTAPVHMTQRLYNAVQQLNAWRYQARWEAHAGAPRLILGRCPYAILLANHPELCQMDAALLEGFLDAGVEPLAIQSIDGRGLRQCIFRLETRKR